jgi:hypothetical protein
MYLNGNYSFIMGQIFWKLLNDTGFSLWINFICYYFDLPFSLKKSVTQVGRI